MNTRESISLVCDVVRHECGDRVLELPLARIRVIAEATDEGGPGADYWLCFVMSANEWYEVSFYTQGRDAFLAALSARLAVPMQLELMDSATFTSRVFWPARLVGRPLFDYSDQVPRNCVGRAAAGLVGWPSSKLQRFTGEVLGYLQGSAVCHNR